MPTKTNIRFEAAFFLAAACLVMVLAANYQVILDEGKTLVSRGVGEVSGESLRVIFVGVVIATIAYSGAIVVVVPVYEFLVELFERLAGPRPKGSGGSPSAGRGRTKKKRRRGTR